MHSWLEPELAPGADKVGTAYCDRGRRGQKGDFAKANRSDLHCGNSWH